MQKYEIPIGKERKLIKRALILYQPEYLSFLNKLDSEEPIFITEEDGNCNLIVMAITNLFCKTLTMKELDFMYNVIPTLPEWLRPYK